MYKVLVIGAVKSTMQTLEQLIKHDFEVVGIMGHEPKDITKVSGWSDLRSQAKFHNLSFKGFQKINSSDNIIWAREKKPDIIFAVGFSQLMSQEWLTMATLGCVGFHPTMLPKGRGRAPLAWITLEQLTSAATFFLMGVGADDGPIFVQEKFVVDKSDDAGDVEKKIEDAIVRGLDNWLPHLRRGLWDPTPQNELEASWYGKRSSEDGHISWSSSANYIDRLIKASSSPHPGAYTYFKDSKVIIWDSELEEGIPIKGVVGRVLLTHSSKGFLIQCGDGLIWIRNLGILDGSNIQVGDKLGYNIEDEIFNIKMKLNSFNI